MDDELLAAWGIDRDLLAAHVGDVDTPGSYAWARRKADEERTALYERMMSQIDIFNQVMEALGSPVRYVVENIPRKNTPSLE